MVKLNRNDNISNIPGDDKRFAKITTDPLFKEISRKERKVIIDERFKHMFEDERFKIGGAKVDKRGRKFNIASSDHLAALYDQQKSDSGTESDNEESAGSLSGQSSKADSDEEINLPIKVDLARGEGNVTSSSSDDSDASEDEYEVEDLITEHEKSTWGEMDREVKRVEWTSRRIAICNLEWDRLSADDLVFVLNSFKSASGTINSVAIYLSDFGAQRIEEEEKSGPQLGGKKITEESIRAYQLDRLRYYYAVCECDSAETAAAIYENCDGVEYEMSGVRFDIRFIPDDMEFDESRLKEKVDSTGANVEGYKPKRFESFALSNVKAKLTWDETNPERKRSMSNAFKDETNLGSYQRLIAPPSDSEDDEEVRQKRLELLLNNDEESKPQEAADDIRIEWDMPKDAQDLANSKKLITSLKQNDIANNKLEDEDTDDNDDEKAIEQHKLSEKDGKKLTPFQEYLERRKQKRKERKAKIRENKMQRKQEIAELNEASKKKPQKRSWKVDNSKSSEVLDLGDSRFSALYTDSAFAIDKTHPLYRGGNLAERQVQEKRRRIIESNNNAPTETTNPTNKPNKAVDANHTEPSELLVDRIKRKMKTNSKSK